MAEITNEELAEIEKVKVNRTLEEAAIKQTAKALGISVNEVKQFLKEELVTSCMDIENKRKGQKAKKKAAEKAWKTMRRRKRIAGKAATKVKDKQWQPEKVKYLMSLKRKATLNSCAVCHDNRLFVLQTHHLDPKKKFTITLCANCHEVVRRGALENLKEAEK